MAKEKWKKKPERVGCTHFTALFREYQVVLSSFVRLGMYTRWSLCTVCRCRCYKLKRCIWRNTTHGQRLCVIRIILFRGWLRWQQQPWLNARFASRYVPETNDGSDKCSLTPNRFRPLTLSSMQFCITISFGCCHTLQQSKAATTTKKRSSCAAALIQSKTLRFDGGNCGGSDPVANRCRRRCCWLPQTKGLCNYILSLSLALSLVHRANWIAFFLPIFPRCQSVCVWRTHNKRAPATMPRHRAIQPRYK